MKRAEEIRLRVQRYWARQREARWGPDYVPAILATCDEAPGRSKPTILCSKNKVGRELHALSSSELAAILVALYSEHLFDLHEQRLLYPTAQTHPLHGHPHYSGPSLPSCRGTVDVAAELGVLDLHSKFRCRDGTGQLHWAPIPYVGDLLLFLRDHNGPYCINWSIKLNAADFGRHGPKELPVRDPVGANRRAAARHDIEVAYYLDFEIRTESIAGSAFPPLLVGNLLDCYAWDARRVPLPDTLRKDLCKRLQSALQHASATPLDLARHFLATRRLPIDAFFAEMYSLIWQRRLRVDLFHCILRDQPLRPERFDLFSTFSKPLARHP